MSNLQEAMAAIIGTFNEYASKDGDPHTLNKAELKELLTSEFGGSLVNASDKAEVDRIFNDLDLDGSGRVDFNEFVMMVAALTAATNEMLRF